MNNIIKGIFVAFSMYSKIPVPQVEWNKNSMKYALFFFPFVGIVITLVFYFIYYICMSLSISPALFASLALVTPILVSGGIHVDGYIDTSDAINSHQSLERKLEILKDPHVGAFAIISSLLYFITLYGLLQQIYINKVIFFAPLCFIISRVLCSLTLVTFNTAKSSGLAHMFSDSADKIKVRNAMFIYLLILLLIFVFYKGYLGLIVFAISIATLYFYNRYVTKYFGGITGDLSGFYILVIEIILIFADVLGGLLV